MRKAVNILVFADLLFLILLSVSGLFDGVVSDTIYLVGFALSITAALVLGRGNLGSHTVLLKKRDALLLLPIIPITIAVIMGLSALTSLALGVFGAESSVVLKGGFFEAVLRYAVLTVILEEILFRYIPLRLASHISPRATAILSALLFALVHCDLYQIPYAFAAGFVFILADMAARSVIPSLVIHFINNLLAVAFYFYSDNKAFVYSCIIALVALAIVGFGVVVIRRKSYINALHPTLAKGRTEKGDFFSVWLLAIPTLTVALIALL